MREKFEKHSIKKVDGKDVNEIEEVSEATATHKHICYHDEENPRPCKLEKL